MQIFGDLFNSFFQTKSQNLVCIVHIWDLSILEEPYSKSAIETRG